MFTVFFLSNEFSLDEYKRHLSNYLKYCNYSEFWYIKCLSCFVRVGVGMPILASWAIGKQPGWMFNWSELILYLFYRGTKATKVAFRMPLLHQRLFKNYCVIELFLLFSFEHRCEYRSIHHEQFEVSLEMYFSASQIYYLCCWWDFQMLRGSAGFSAFNTQFRRKSYFLSLSLFSLLLSHISLVLCHIQP